MGTPLEPSNLGDEIEELFLRAPDKNRLIYYILILFHEFVAHKSNWLDKNQWKYSESKQITLAITKQIKLQKSKVAKKDE